VAHQTPPPEEREAIDLKDPVMAAILAWMIPGLGHLYQGRTAKAILMFVCIMGTFAYGVGLGGRSDLGWGRVVYASWSPDETRLPFLCQVGVGLPAMPAVIQAVRVRSGKEPWLDGFMAPPGQPGRSFDELNKELGHRFELGTVYTMIAGLLNILAIYDAWGGPVFAEPRRRKEDGEEGDEKPDADKDETPQKETVGTAS
jgi:hypothetical protein